MHNVVLNFFQYVDVIYVAPVLASYAAVRLAIHIHMHLIIFYFNLKSPFALQCLHARYLSFSGGFDV